MIKTLIVDDEELMRKGLIALMDWEKHGFEVVGEAENGSQAIQFIEGHQVDLVMTDIRMPEMNGLNFMKNIVEKYARLKVIVLSGYDDFSYAKAALESGASGYILKPIEEEEVLKALLKVKKEINQLLKEKIVKTELISIAREDFMRRLLEGKIVDVTECAKKLEEFHVDFSSHDYCVCMGQIEKSDFLKVSTCENEVQVLTTKVMDHIRHDITHDHMIEFVEGVHGEFFLIFNGEESILLREWILEKLKLRIHQDLEVACTFGIGLPCTDITGISRSYGEAKEALKYKVNFGNNTIIDYRRILDNREVSLFYPLEIEQKLFTALINGTEQDVKTYITSFFEAVLTNNLMHFEALRSIIAELIVSLKRYLLNYNLEIRMDSYKAWSQLNSEDNIAKIQGAIADIILEVKKELNNSKHKASKRIVEEIKNYVNEYYDIKITIDDMANRAFISKSYFCKIFKEETGMSFVQYLIFVRIERAKKILIDSNLKNYEVSKEIGIEDVSYFNEVFKKNVGLTPLEYKSLHKKS